VLLLLIAATLVGCEGSGVTRVEGERDRDGRRHPSHAVMAPICRSLYRVGGPFDPAGPNYNPDAAADTALMHVAHTFLWSGDDPAGLCDTLLFSWVLDSGWTSGWVADTSAVFEGLSGGSHVFSVVAGCPDVRGTGRRYEFVVNFDPEGEILEPMQPSGTLAIADGDTVWFRLTAHDREELAGVGGGVAQIAMDLDGQVRIFDCPPDTVVWWFTSAIELVDPHWIGSVNLPTGGNRAHELSVLSCDVDDRWETAGETYIFWYNFSPESTVTYPVQGGTVGTDFWVTWEGIDVDGEVTEYEYALDPWINSWNTISSTEVYYHQVEPGEHEFRIRARDNRDCWELEYEIVGFTVQ